MVLRGRYRGTAYRMALSGASLTAAVGERVVVACDRGGRLYSLSRNGRMHRRSLNGRVLEKWHDRDGRHHRWLDEGAADHLLDDAALEFAGILAAVRSGTWIWDHPVPEAARTALLDALECGARFTAGAAHRDAARFQRVYGEVGILPPDHYLSLVLLATDGCMFGSCTFCSLYGRKFHVRSRAGFARHVEEVRDYFGPSLGLRRRAIFLGAANAIAVPMPLLVSCFREIEARFGRPPRGVHAFVDGFTGARKSEADYRVLAGLGLRRVYLGLESGDDDLLESVGKPSRAADVLATVASMKAAGLSVGIMVMIGLGGARYAASHVARTAEVVNLMGLDGGDLLYFSDLEPDSGWRDPGPEGGAVDPLLGPAARGRQRSDIVNRLRFGAPPRIADYNIREFIY